MATATLPRTLMADAQDEVEALRLLLKSEENDMEAASWGGVPLDLDAIRRGHDSMQQQPDAGQLLSTLRRQLEAGAAARAEGRREMQDAIATQQALLPQTIPQVPGVDISVAWMPAGEMSGDYLGLIPLAGRRLGIAVGDVAGKGMSAALLMSNLQAAMRVLAPDVRSPERLAARVNRLVCANTSGQKFITLFYGVLDQYCLTYTNAGHNAPMLVRANGQHFRLETGGLVLGVLPDWNYRQSHAELAPGDRLLLFSDGITEAENPSGVPFGEERLLDLLVRHRRLDATRLRREVMAGVVEFSHGAPQDDATLVAIAVN